MPGSGPFKHIFIDKPTDRQDYTKPPLKITKIVDLPDRDRSTHSAYLEKRFNESWDSFAKKLEERKAVVHTERHGAYIEFTGEPGYPLNIKSLEDFASKTKARLRNVRSEVEGGSNRILATVYIPYNKRSKFLKKIREYAATESNTENGKSKHEKLFSSISDIRLAIMESFWRSEERSKIPEKIPDWVEVWVSTEREDGLETFHKIIENLQIEILDKEIVFPERVVKLIKVNREMLELLLESSDDIAEFRAGRAVVTEYIDKPSGEQARLSKELLERCSFREGTDISICILDTGINNGHDLIRPVLNNDDLHAVDPKWNTNDDRNHGTLMAGTATYGDLLDILDNSEPVYISHVLESSKILPPPPAQNPKDLWGDITAQGIFKAEIQSPNRKRITCLAITAPDDADRGRPSSWSGKVDELASGYEEEDKKRLIIISAGNAGDSEDYRNYADAQKSKEIEDPAQAWNALTVGASTEKTDVESLDSTYDDYQCIAPSGGLSPYSTSSFTWPSGKWPIKPEVLFEGGNVVCDSGSSIFDETPLALLSTYSKPHDRQFDPFWGTSAASALAARMAAMIQAQYPDKWPETVRGLIVHSADWTDTMKRQFLKDESKTAYGQLLKMCGYGVPNLDHALSCMSNSLTLISETELQPYERNGSRNITKDMHIYDLPWPKKELLDLAETPIKMRVTLSYFIEPGPENVGWNNRYRYPSHALRFSINRFDETQKAFAKRINKKARDEGETLEANGSSDNWVIGSTARDVGSIHSDIWQGSAAELATSNLIAIYPVSGWWKERTNLKRGDSKCRYSLIVSIYSPKLEVDIYTPVSVKIGIPNPVPVEIPIGKRRTAK